MATTETTTPFRSVGPKLGFVPSFDGIRGIGVMMVLLQHAYPVAESFSSIVDVFFIISGFLITTLLFEEHQKTSAISLRNFYIRRGLRLLPGLVVVLAVGFVAAVVLIPGAAKQTGLESLATLFYVHNIFYPPIQGTYQVMGQMWSLSVEEQFYLVVSILMFFAIPRRQWIKPIFAVLVAFYVGVNISRITGHMGPAEAWFQRPDACAMGMIAAIVNAWIPPLGDRYRKLLWWLGGISAAGVVTSFITSSPPLVKRGFGVEFLPPIDDRIVRAAEHALDKGRMGEVNRLIDVATADGIRHLTDHWYWVRWGFTLGSLSAGVLTICLVRLGPTWSVQRFLATPVFRYLGRASYAVYIVHYQLYRAIDPMLPGGDKVRAVFKIIIGLGVGLAIHQWIEQPALKLKNRFSWLSTSKPPTTVKE